MTQTVSTAADQIKLGKGSGKESCMDIPSGYFFVIVWEGALYEYMNMRITIFAALQLCSVGTED